MRFQTHRRLWLWISLLLVAAIWCFVPIGIKSETHRPIVLLWDWVGYIFNSDRREMFGVGVTLLLFACISGILAAVVAWPLQALIVVFRRAIRGGGTAGTEPNGPGSSHRPGQ
jgi:hypothetical protein